MTAKSDDFETGLLQLIFQNSTTAMSGATAIWSALGDGISGSTSAGTLTVALYTTPGPGETLLMNAATLLAYTGYSNQTLARSSVGWTIGSGTPDTASNATALTFGQSTDVPAGPLASHVAVGVGTGAVAVLYQGPLDSALQVNLNVNPQFAVAALAVTEA